MAAHARLKIEFTEDEKCHNLMRWRKFFLFPDGLDNQELCKGRSIFLQKLEDTDLIVMKAKTNELKTSPAFEECTIKFSPSSRAKKRTTLIAFESFHIYDCDTYLLVQQSPSEFFDRQLSTLVRSSAY